MEGNTAWVRPRREEDNMKVKVYGLGILVSGLVTGILLLLLSWGLYQFRWSNSVLQMGVWAVYGLSSLAGGFLVGKKLRSRRFLWGMLMGVVYFLILFVISGATTGGWSGNLAEMAAACGICLAGGMLGGMLS